ncbi:MAG: hypothetical protein ACE5IB_04120, partial [Candidatus Geothermarchaeales archaeon]
ELEDMLQECFDEMARLIHFHGRDRRLPVDRRSGVFTVRRSESEIERVGADVRRLAYTDLDFEVESLFDYVSERKVDFELLRELGIQDEDRDLISNLLKGPSVFQEECGLLNARKWVRILERAFRGYISRQFNPRYWNLLFTVWHLRSLAFFLNEAADFSKAEESTRRQANYAFQLFQENLRSQASQKADRGP